MNGALLSDISGTSATIIAAIVGFGGAIVGGASTLLGQVVNDRAQRRKAGAVNAAQAAATAILIQDDFLHDQATLARSLDRWTWWKPAELLPDQADVSDRKTVWAALPEEKRWVVSGAQGWMDYLIQNRKLQPPGDTPEL